MLPGTRELAKKIHVNRKTVIQAYDELIAQGWLTSESKRGTFVSSRVITINNLNQRKKPILNSAKTLLQSEFISSYHKQLPHEFIDFSDGLPDSRLIPFEVLSRAMRRALISSARNNKASYGDPKGASILRDAIAEMLNMERAMHSNSENICVVRGGQMGLFVIAKILIANGDNVIVEKLGNTHARETFCNCGANILFVEHDDEGINIDHLNQICQQNKIRAIYVTPQHQIPTTITMTQSRRNRLVELAEQFNFVIIEDDSDHEFNFANNPMMPIASIKNNHHVIYIGSLSKILTPDFRVGYISASNDIIRLCAEQTMLIDRQGNQITELAIAELLHTGEIKKHILRAQKIYQERRLFLSELIHKEIGDFVNFKLNDNGLSFWLEISSMINIKKFLIDAEKHKVHFQLGSVFCEDETQASGIRMGFAHLNQEEAIIGITRLKNAFCSQQIKATRVNNILVSG